MKNRRAHKRYSKVSLEVWGDDKFTSLTPLPPSGQSLWLYLLLCPFRSLIPGLLLNVGLGAISDRLQWTRRAIDQHWGEISQQRMAKADWKAGVIWMPRGIEHNPPESPNVVTSWRTVVLPSSPLVVESLDYLHGRLATKVMSNGMQVFDEGFLQAFRKAFPKVCGRPCGNQEQDQEQEEEPPYPPSAEGGKAITRSERSWAEAALSRWQREHGQACPHEPRCGDEYTCVGRIVGEKRVAESKGIELASGAARRVR